MRFSKHQFLFNLVFCAIMAALSVVLEKLLSFPKGNSYLKFTLYGLPLMFTGIFLGYKYGLLSGLVTGIILQLTSEYGITITAPFWALAPIAWGLIPGIFSSVKHANLKIINIIILVIVTSFSALLLNTLAMFTEIWLMNSEYYSIALIFTELPPRIISAIILCPIYISLIYIIYNSLIKHLINNTK